MGLPIPHVKFLIKIFKKYNIKGTVLSLSSQDVYINEKQLKKLLDKNKIEYKNLIIQKTNSLELKKFKESKDYISPLTLFNSLGIYEKDYFDIDKFDFDKAKIIYDLQKPIKKKFYNKYNFILDSGTLEHIFDTTSVLKNLVKITKTGGRICHIIPVHNYVNHGFYSFSPTFIYDFYTQNKFKIEEMYITELGSLNYRFYKYNHVQSLDGYYLNRSKRYLMFALLKKTKVLKEIIIPDQSFYVKRAKIESKNKLIETLKNNIPFKFHSLFWEIFYKFKKLNFKRQFFDFDHSI